VRSAPAFAVTGDASLLWRLSCIALGSAASAAVAAWMVGHLEWAFPGSWLLPMLAAVGGVGLGLRLAGPRSPALVRWDGQGWHIDGVAGELQLRLDLGAALLLLRHRAPGARAWRWLALSFPQRGGDLRTLRTALYSPALEATLAPPHVRAPDRAPD